MAVAYKLMDLDSGNLVGSYVSIEEAYGIVRETLDSFGPTGVVDLGLFRVAGETRDLVGDGETPAHFAVNERVA